ncbi:MAG: gamma-glutamyl-gamma-aminobutyrate hydrolase family protein [Actinobacteria bacterium]|nr:gamma-glutamyl-gamma-aminobutyrate hydrolase family protein [Actinomycetota bacterium]
MRPLIGITSYAQEASWGAWVLPAALLPLSYVRSVVEAGGRPLLVPPVEDAVEETLDALDGLILSGGADIDPEAYGADPHPETMMTFPDRDRAELELLRAALAREMPVLAICRGMQIMNVLHGGGLHQHLPDLVGHEGHRETPGVFSAHEVRIAPESKVGRLIGEQTHVHSSHHQGLDRVGDGMQAVGWAQDGSIEAIEDPGHRFALGVLWHPEEHEDKRLFEALVAEAREHRKAKRS